ncbi:hypothetical protein E4U49_001177 [Claviceps purpurea]|nr:hypothetical protein E4U49_001177 [Claviceps purpurea]
MIGWNPALQLSKVETSGPAPRFRAHGSHGSKGPAQDHDKNSVDDVDKNHKFTTTTMRKPKHDNFNVNQR